eukprot:Em0015g571a
MATAATLSSQANIPNFHIARSGLKKLRTSSGQESNDEAAANSPDETSCRILVPSQKKLTTLESQRVAAVMDEGPSSSRFSVSLGSELVAMLAEYQTLALDYTKCCAELLKRGLTPTFERSRYTVGNTAASSQPVTKTARLRPLDEGGAGGEHCDLETQFSHAQSGLKQCTKSILRAMCRTPSGASIVRSVSKERSKMSGGLLEGATELQRVMNEKLLTSKVEEDRRKMLLKQVLERQAKADEEIKKLEAELAEALRLKNEEIAAKTLQLKRLKSDIQSVVRLAQEGNRRVHEEASKQMSEDQASYDLTKQQLTQEVAALKKAYQDMVDANRDKEQMLRKRAFKRETEVENWIGKYDNEMEEKQNELESLQTEYETEKQQLKELEEKLEILSIEHSVVVKEQEEARRRVEEANKKMSHMIRAATMIQSMWRSYHCRKQLLKEKQKGKKKGKKGKKGKKKK